MPFPTPESGIELAYTNLDIWTSHDKAARVEMAKATYHSEVNIYIGDDEVSGLYAVEDRIEQFLASVGGSFERKVIEPVVEAHDLVVLNWEMIKEGKIVLRGADINLIEDTKVRKCWVIFK